jgi:hypothetical protein
VKLKQMKDRGLLNVTHDPLLDEHLYYIDKAPTPHNNAAINFYSNLIHYKYKVKAFDLKKQYNYGKKVEADGFCVWESQNGIQIALIEVDLYHNTDIHKYENIHDNLVDLYGDMPYLIILSLTPRKVSSQNITIINLDLKCTDFMTKVLPL